MKFLLDTHAFLWAVLDNPRLSDKARALMLNADNELLVSPASYWEIAIEISLGKYALDNDFEAFMERQTVYSEFTPLPISIKHAAVVATLPFHHRDSFDRLLVAQSAVRGNFHCQRRPPARFLFRGEDLVVSKRSSMSKYEIIIFWSKEDDADLAEVLELPG